jgi:hypothetical protein
MVVLPGVEARHEGDDDDDGKRPRLGSSPP